ncbi:hypothetical protein GCM10011494_28110 [Novosphingobium endophyticum]|uniref:DUF1269 domain-containing protein n=1 Tax=Novosphingobium endophyticum TaxID=1955250 RepID=A0A916TU60_9SPHN|nr:hypothetical protein [Novosphingobium endophyticum]GGC07848.1 hypothetical protein GCM10011494_28110 [Novosphingobium endophyticum]
MGMDADTTPAFVIKAEDLPALHFLHPNHPQPLLYEWINRGTDQKMRRSSIEMLLRTLSHDEVSPSVARLHHSSGLRVSFRTSRERDLFAAAFSCAHNQLNVRKQHLVAAMFDERADAERVVSELKSNDIPDSSISLLWRAGQFRDPDNGDWQGHSKLSVAAAAAGGGIAGAMLGAAILFIPGIGLVAAAGAIAASSFSSVASVSAIIGATGGAMARMLTDHDVDGREANYFEGQIRRGKVFVSVDTRIAEGQREIARRILLRNGGHVAPEG